MGHEFQSALRRWDVLAHLCKDESFNGSRYSTGILVAEVGCKEGRTTEFLLKNDPNVHVVAIDPWEPVPNSAEDYSDFDYDRIVDEFTQRCTPYKDRIAIYKGLSLDAAKHYADLIASGKYEPFHVVFIDAGHDYENCHADIEAWWPLVRPGGYLAGHDYQHKFPGVMRAVADHFRLTHVAVSPDSVWHTRKV